MKKDWLILPVALLLLALAACGAPAAVPTATATPTMPVSTQEFTSNTPVTFVMEGDWEIRSYTDVSDRVGLPVIHSITDFTVWFTVSKDVSGRILGIRHNGGPEKYLWVSDINLEKPGGSRILLLNFGGRIFTPNNEDAPVFQI